MLKKFRRRFSNKGMAATMRRNADHLRDSRLWDAAARLYKSYLDLRPQDAGIWVQLGHCQKEAGRLDEADLSYGRAVALAPDNADIWLQIGHLRKLQERVAEAVANYAKALTKDSALMPARLELGQLGYGPSDIARLIAERDSHAVVERFVAPNEQISTRPYPIQARLSELTSKVEELACELGNHEERIAEVKTRFDEIEELITDQSRQLEHLLALMPTVRALGFAMKRQEARVEALKARFDEPEEQVVDQFHQIERVPALNATVEALTSRQEAQAAKAPGRPATAESRIDRFDRQPSDVMKPRHLGPEADRNFDRRWREGFFEKYLSGDCILDIGYRGANPLSQPITEKAIGIDLDYPDYDGKRLPFPEGSQDAVFTSHALEHIEDWAGALADWYRVLKVDGFMVIAVPHRDLYERKADLPSRFNADHKRFYTPASLLDEIEKALPVGGYRIRLLKDVDEDFDYTIPPIQHAVGCYEIEIVLQKINIPEYSETLRPLRFINR